MNICLGLVFLAVLAKNEFNGFKILSIQLKLSVRQVFGDSLIKDRPKAVACLGVREIHGPIFQRSK